MTTTRNRLPLALATAALVVAVLGLTPVGEAAKRIVIPKGAVGTPQLRNNAVTGAKVRNGSLTTADFAAGQIPAGAKGDKGDPGAPGPKGDKGEPATSLWAAVAKDGSARGAKGVTATQRTGLGNYFVQFDRDVSTCALVATVNEATETHVSARSFVGNVKQVVVVTQGGAGDHAFSLAAYC